MSKAVKRYCMRAFGSIVQPIEVPYSGTWVPSADHDRIVSSLTETGRKMQAERDAWRNACKALQVEEEKVAAMDGELTALRAEVERLRKDAELEREMQRAASELPDDWEIRVCVERGAGWVELTNPDGEGIADTWSGQESLSCEVSDAIDAAIRAEGAGDE